MKRPPENITNDRGKRKCVNNFECLSPYSVPLEEGELGLIESVTVQNFMCHENFTLKFGPHMNFLIGQNGSGKSALLTAIILALGGRSSSTDRHTSIKGFVKTGKNKAKVEVVLRNGGDLPYKPETYGEKIVVVREFTKDGISSYKIKSETGTICSTAKKELTNIMDAMNIMVECPVCVLTQSTSKNFLISKEASGEKLFQFFYKGTGLELLENKYKSMDDSKESAEAELNRKKQSIPILKKELKKWHRFIESSQRISDYKNELIWANVIAMEKAVQEKEEEHKKIAEEFEEHKRTLAGCKKSFTEKSLELDELNKQKSELDTEMEKYRKKLEELKAEHENHSSSYRRNKGTFQKLGNDKKKLEEDIRGLEKCINEQKRKDQRNLEEEDRKRQEAIQILAAENINLKEKLETFRQTINTKRNEQSTIEKAIENLRHEVGTHTFQCNNIQDHLVATQNAIRNKVNAFGEHTEKVLREISRMRGRFKKMPVGPIGIYLEVKDLSWAAAVEFATSYNLLNSFCVDNHQDSLLLREILKIYPRPPAIIVSQFEPQMFDVQHGKVQSSYPSVLDMLKINNHLVANCLIDQAQIEKKILIEDENLSLMNNPPKNCKSAYYMNCDQICFNPSRFYAFDQKKKARTRLSAIRVEDVRNLEKERDEKKAIIQEINRKIEAMVEAKKSLPGQMEQLEREVVKISTDYKKKLMEISELQRSEEKKDVDCLQEDLQTLYHSYKQKENEIEQYQQVISTLESKKLDLEGQITVLSSKLKSLTEEYHKLHIKLSEVFKLKENFGSGKRKYELELRCKENKCKMDEDRLKDMQSKLESTLSRAESTCERIHTERSSEEISRSIKETERVVEAQSNCERENLIKKYKEKTENLQRAEMELKRLEKLLNRIGEMIRRRNTNFIKIRKNTELLIGLSFTTILSGNGYMGHLIFGQDHDKTLTMNVSTRASDRTRKNHSSLSGGERSFVTIAFLLALWERTKMPFRILDEYDVFMDSSNRQLSIDLLCKKAGEMCKTQFILLSPLDLIRPPFDYIEILRLAPPKRKVDDENSPRKKRT